MVSPILFVHRKYKTSSITLKELHLDHRDLNFGPYCEISFGVGLFKGTAVKQLFICLILLSVSCARCSSVLQHVINGSIVVLSVLSGSGLLSLLELLGVPAEHLCSP